MAKKNPEDVRRNPDAKLPRRGLSRREFLAGVAATTGALALGGCGESETESSDPESQPLPSPESSGIDHIIVLMMENRSFDHFLGWVPGADGRQAGLSFTDKQAMAHATYHLTDFQNCQLDDPDHSYQGGRTQYNSGANDGWLRAGTNDLFPIGYFAREDLSFFGPAVPAWTTFDRYFAAILGPTFPNRFFLHAGQTDRLETTPFPFATFMPTIWDRLAASGISGEYYASDLPFVALWGSRYVSISKTVDDFLSAAAAGTLPNVAFVDPRFNGESQGTSNDDHPLADIRNGEVFMNQIYEAVIGSPNWESSVLIITYDEWGGFYDHVPPPLAPQTELDVQIGNDGRLGFRLPCLIVSPLARRGFVGHKQYDHTSILNFIEWRWGLESMTVRDMTANNIGHALDFSRPKNLSAPHFNVPPGPFGNVCTADMTAARPEIAVLRKFADQYGFSKR